MYEIIRSNDGTINIYKNKKALINRVMHEENTQIAYVPDLEKPNLFMITENLETMQTTTFYGSNGNYITGIGFNGKAYEKAIEINSDLVQHSSEYDDSEEDEEYGVDFFIFNVQREAFSLYITNDFAYHISNEKELYNVNKYKKQTDNFFAYSYFGEVIATAKFNSEQEAEDSFYEFLDNDSELVS
ncbi:MAG: hypothetical protein CVV59_00740 [Tenericutes bacterium HGW-Tenericutes-4]|nr:MAG: hypothetical protein CVV59_00740 [Tenericutes bacterium HGW-Tenericutes-4]